MQLLLWNGGRLIVSLLAFALVFRMDRQLLPRQFWMGVLALAGVLSLAGLVLSDPAGKFQDFRRAYWEAGVAVWNGPSQFAEVYGRGTDGFVNIPVVGYLFAPFGLLGEIPASLAFTLLGVFATAAAWRLLCLHYKLERREAALLAVAFAIFGPLLYSLSEGNLSHFLLLGFAGALILLGSGRHLSAGLVLGLIAVLKPSLGLIGVYFLLRGQWRVVAGGAIMCIGAGLSSLAIFGWDMNMLWYQQTVAPFAEGPVPAFNAQSIPAFIARTETGLAGLRNWDAHALSQAGGIASLVLSALAGIAFLAVCLRRGVRPPSGPVIELELLLVVAVSCVVSSLSWSHYYVWLLPAFIWAWQNTVGRARQAVLASFILCAPLEFLSAQMESGVFGPLTNLLTSHLLVGGLVLLIILLWKRWEAPAAA